MFENEIKFISDFSLNKIKHLGSFVTFEKLSMSELHPAIVTYISAELDYMIYRDRKKLLQNSIFDYTGREISDHFNVIASEIKKSKKISIDDIEKLILQAVSFNVNYVVRPKWSITKLIYNNQDFVSVDELERMLNYLYYYDYIKSVLSAYVSRRKVLQLTVTEFDLILNKIDRELFKSNSEELINNALYSISDIFNLGGIEKTRVSLAAVEIFLREKNLMDFLLKLRHAISNKTKNKYEISDITKIFYSTKTIYPESIQSSPEKESFADQKVKSEPEMFEEKVETIEFHDSEIVTEEKIKSKISEDEPALDEIIIEETLEDVIPESETDEEDLLPIEEELGGDLVDEKTKSETVEAQVEIDESGETLLTEPEIEQSFEDELIGLVEENKEIEKSIEDELVKEEEPKTAEDDLLAFYEEELTTMDEDEIVSLTSEDQIKIVADEISEKVQKPGEDKQNNNAVDKSEIVSEEIVGDVGEDDKIDFSIFDDEEAEIEFNEILSKVSSDFHSELTQADDTEDENVHRQETDTPVDSKTTESLVDNTDNVDLSADKAIIDEMLNDYFGESGAMEKETEDKSSNQSTETVDDKISDVPATTDDSEQTTESLTEETQAETDYRLLDDIDDIIEKDSLDRQESETIDDESESEQQEELPLDEEFKFDDEAAMNKDVHIEEELDDVEISEDETVVDESKSSDKHEEKTEDRPRGEGQKIREKDLFSYLSRKEVKKIVSNVFANDYEDFATTIEKISECVAYKHATEILKSVFFTYRISPYSKDAVILTNAVSHYFRQV